MKKEINLEDIFEFHTNSPKIQKNIFKTNTKVIDNFDIDIPSGKRYNQKSNERCWVYAGFNTILNNVCKNMNIKISNIQFSSAYFAFYDYLERSNSIYQEVINSRGNNIKDIKKVCHSHLKHKEIMGRLNIL